MSHLYSAGAKRKSDYVAYYREKATIIKDDKFPEMPLV